MSCTVRSQHFQREQPQWIKFVRGLSRHYSTLATHTVSAAFPQCANGQCYKHRSHPELDKLLCWSVDAADQQNDDSAVVLCLCHMPAFLLLWEDETPLILVGSLQFLPAAVLDLWHLSATRLEETWGCHSSQRVSSWGESCLWCPKEKRKKKKKYKNKRHDLREKACYVQSSVFPNDSTVYGNRYSFCYLPQIA